MFDEENLPIIEGNCYGSASGIPVTIGTAAIAQCFPSEYLRYLI